jgi:hypothetical protein
VKATRAGTLLALAPAILYVALLPRFGRLPYNDYWGILGGLVSDGRLSRDPKVWLLVRNNEHLVDVPALVYAANVALTHGDNRALSAFALGVLAVQVVVLWRLLPELDPEPRAVRPVWRGALGLVLGVLVFTPAAAHSVVMGFSGTIWFLANLLAVAAVALLVRAAGPARPFGVVPVLLVGLVASLTYSTSLSLWPALLLGAWLLGRPWRDGLVLGAGAGAVYLLRTLAYRPNPHHPDPVTAPLDVLQYGAAYLGNPFAARFGPAVAVGSVGLVLALAGLAVVLRSGAPALRASAAPWLMLQVYALGNALGTAVWRSGFGWLSSSRYVSVAVLFWVGLIGLGLALLGSREGPARPWCRLHPAPMLAASATIVLACYVRGIPVLIDNLERAARQPEAERALLDGSLDLEALKTISRVPSQVVDVAPYLRASSHVPFDPP